MIEGAGQFSFAPNIRNRFLNQQYVLRNTTDFSERRNYSYTRGDYSKSHHYIVESSVLGKAQAKAIFNEDKSVEDLRSMELFLAGHINSLMAVKTDPILVMDIGGMAGLSWVRLAKHFEKEVKEGRIAFVVTNLIHSPEKNVNLGGRLNQEEKSFIDKNHDLVHFQIAKPSEFRKIEVTLPDGRKVKLGGQVDIAFENLSVTPWSRAPDLDILRIGSLLSPYGAYFVPTRDTESVFSPDTKNEQTERIDGIKLAHKQLQTIFGLKRVTHIEDGPYLNKDLRYIVFKGKQAPDIRI